MTSLPVDYLADVLRVDLGHRGCARVILLGTEDAMTPGGLRSALARWGLQVLVPPEAMRGWISSLATIPADDLSSVDVDRLRLLLEDGAEHGVQAIVCTSESLGCIVDACALAVPTVALNPRGAVVPVRNVVLDMGGVLFEWDPVAMARRVCESEDDARLLAQEVFCSQEWAWQDAGAIDQSTVAWTAKTRLPRRLRAQVDELVLHWHDRRDHVDGMDELIRDLKSAGYGIYLLSNAGEAFTRYQAQLPARAFFDGVVVSCYEHVVKPDARIYRILLDRFGLAAGECLFVDDNTLNVLGARRVGMRGFCFEGSADVLRRILLR